MVGNDAAIGIEYLGCAGEIGKGGSQGILRGGQRTALQAK